MKKIYNRVNNIIVEVGSKFSEYPNKTCKSQTHSRLIYIINDQKSQIYFKRCQVYRQ